MARRAATRARTPAPSPSGGAARVSAGRSQRGLAGSAAWIEQRLMRVVEEAASPDALAEAADLARAGQIVRVAIDAGRASVTLRAKNQSAREITLGIRPIRPATWRKALDALAREALFAAAIQAGRVPTSVDDAFAPLGVRLFPVQADEISVDGPGAKPWSATACWAMRVLADRLAREPLALLTWRGMKGERVVEEVRDRRAALAGRLAGPQPAYLQSPPPAAASLDDDLPADPAAFWSSAEEPDALSFPPRSPEATHTLLRRLGTSPFEEGAFPILGLLATCYSALEQTGREGGESAAD